ncbi:MAG: cytochrome P450 [Solirubrobacterales bacterium]
MAVADQVKGLLAPLVPDVLSGRDLPPGPRGLDNALFVAKTTNDFMRPLISMAAEYGPVSATFSRGRTLVLLANHEAARHVLVTNQDNYVKGIEYELLRIVLGEGLLTSEGERWQTQRRLVQPLFAKRHIGEFVGQMTDATRDALDAGPFSDLVEGERLDINRALMELTLDVVGRTLFGADLTGETARRVAPAMNDVLLLGTRMVRRLPTFVIASLPGFNMRRAIALNPESIRFRRAVEQLREVIDELLIEREMSGDPGEDLFGLMLTTSDPETGEPMERNRIADELMTFMLAGHETTSNALSWAFRWLSLNPEARETMVGEVDEVLQGRTPSFEDAERLPWTKAVVEESMRLSPPAWMVGRKAVEEDHVGGYRIPAGASAMVLIRSIHRDPEVWENPEGFDPRRFLPENRGDLPRSAYLPFGAGRRICVGSTFALVEATLLLAMISQRYEFDLPPWASVTEDAAITLRPRGGLEMVVRPRSESLESLTSGRAQYA